MALFDLPNRSDKALDKKLASKSKQSKAKSKVSVKSGGGLLQKISAIKQMVERTLGKYKDEYTVISDKNELLQYMDECIKNNVISIDTETDGLDPILNNLAGVCIYTPNQKPAYVPANHISYITGERVDNQLTNSEIAECLQKVIDAKIDIIMFNASFDIRVLRNQCNLKDIYCTWDCYLAARILNENEEENALKKLHRKYVLNGAEDAFKFDELFDDVLFTQVPITVGYLYAAHDAIITYELYLYQKPYLTPSDSLCIENGYQKMADYFHNVEMCVVPCICDMEDNGVSFDLDYNKQLYVEYHGYLDKFESEFHRLISEMYSKEVEEYRLKTGSSCKLENPISITSSSQLAILLYDIMGLEPQIDRKTKQPSRSTNKETLPLYKDNPVVKAILDYRQFSTIVSMFIDKLPDKVNPKDGKIHCKFNQYGADTGRMSSSGPNLQQIPSHDKKIRQMFKAQDGYVLMSSDYSSQEPKALAALCAKRGDRQMLDTFLEGKDLYSEIASKSFHYPYEECLEFRPDGTTNKEGKERRSQAKSKLIIAPL